MKISLAVMALSLTTYLAAVSAQTVTTAPTVGGCPSPIPKADGTGMPANGCKPIFYPLTDTTHAIAAPSYHYKHTLPGYAPADVILACPKGAILSSDASTCADSAGKDASKFIHKIDLASFALVTSLPPPVGAKITLTWTAPSKNSDGTAFTDLARYNIYQGTAANSLTQIGTAIVPTFTTPALPFGVTEYLAVSTVNKLGVESDKSAIITVTPAATMTKPGSPTDLKASQ